jgi:hypothetical protein
MRLDEEHGVKEQLGDVKNAAVRGERRARKPRKHSILLARANGGIWGVRAACSDQAHMIRIGSGWHIKRGGIAPSAACADGGLGGNKAQKEPAYLDHWLRCIVASRPTCLWP